MLAGLVKLGGGGHVPEQLAGTVFGAGTIAVVGLVGRRLGGERVGLIAAALAAVYPMLVSADGALMSESVYGLLIALFLLAAYRLIERPSDLRAIVFGGLLGLAALARGEAILLAPLVLVPVLRLPRGRRSALLAGLALVLVLAPWTIRNATVFHRLVPISTNFASAIAGANCPSTYYGSKIGDWDNACVKPHPGNEAQAYNRAESDGLRYAAHHLGRLPVVFAVRLARMWGFRRNMFTKLPQLEARSAIVVALGFAMYYLLVPFAVYGVVLLRRRRVAVWPLGIMFVLVSVVALMTYGEVRFREPAEIALVVFAAVGVEELLARRGAGVPLNLALASVRAP